MPDGRSMAPDSARHPALIRTIECTTSGMSGKPLWDGDAVGRFITQAGSAAVRSVE